MENEVKETAVPEAVPETPPNTVENETSGLSRGLLAPMETKSPPHDERTERVRSESLVEQIIASVPVKEKRKRTITEKQKQHLAIVRAKALEVRRQNTKKRAEEKALEKEIVIKEKINQGVEDKLSNTHSKLLDKYELLQKKYDELIKEVKPEPTAMTETQHDEKTKSSRSSEPVKVEVKGTSDPFLSNILRRNLRVYDLG